MKDLEKYRDYWSQQSLSTTPIDRPATEAAIRNLFRCANEPEPEYFLWFDSPREGAGAAHILFVEKDPERFAEYWNQLIRRKRIEWERVRQLILDQTGARDWKMLLTPQGDGPAETSYVRALRLASGTPWLFFGPRYHLFLDASQKKSNSTNTGRKRVQEASDKIRQQQQQTDPLRMLQEDVDEVTWKCFYSSVYFRPPYQLQAQAEGPGQWGYSEFDLLRTSFGQLARLDFMAKETGEAIPAGYLALIEVGRQVNLWWAAGKVAVICDRPSELHRNNDGRLHNAEGPAMVYRNGWKVHAVNGEWIVPSAPAPPRRREIKPRLLERYQAGDRIGVWNDLRALDELVRTKEYEADALAVARATMERARHNVLTIIERLKQLNFEFAHQPHTKTTGYQKVEKKLGPLPMSLKAWWEIVGAVNLMGSHDLLCGSVGLSDPLWIYPPEATLEDNEESECILAPDRYHKHGYSGGAPYAIGMPSPTADALVLYEPNEVQFVDYLRLCFRYGGFPGLQDDETRIPAREMAILTEGLLEI